MNEVSVAPRQQRCRPLSVWELPASLLTSVHRFRKRKSKRARERSHYPAILAFVYRSRFVTASQVQRRFGRVLRSDRTARRHLAEMQESLGYLDLIPTPSPLWPKVYAVSGRGLGKLARSLKDKRIGWAPCAKDRSRRKGFSIYHVIHELFITEFLLLVWEAVQGDPELELLTIQRRSLDKHPAFLIDGGSASRLIPDAMFLLRHRHRGMICTFLEIDTGSMSLKQLGLKLDRYAEWAESQTGKDFLTDLYRGNGAESPSAVFRIAFVCGGNGDADGQDRLLAVQRVTAELPAIRRRIWLTTADGLNGLVLDKGLLSASIWNRWSRERSECIAQHEFL